MLRRGSLHTLLELELFHALLVWGDGSTLYTNRVFLDGLGGIEGHLVVGLVTVFQAKIVVLEVNVEVGVDELSKSVSVVPARLFVFFSFFSVGLGVPCP